MSEDRDFVDAMIRIGSTVEGIARVRDEVVPIAGRYGTVWPTNCCALFQSAVLNLAGIPFGYEASAGRFAYKLGGALGSRNWDHIPVGKQQPGDIGVCFDMDHRVPGSDHVYLVVRAINDNEMLIADNQQAGPHLRCADGSPVAGHGTTPTEYFLRAPGYVRVAPEGNGNSPLLAAIRSQFGIAASLTQPKAEGAAAILAYASASPFLDFDWSNGQHRMPKGYLKGMALVYGRVYCKLMSYAPEAIAMALADRNDPKTDALSWYGAEYRQLGLDNTDNGVGPLRSLFNLLIGLGVHESSGRYFCGRDRNANFIQSHSAEAGLFQASFGARAASPYMSLVCNLYRNRNDFLCVFQEGVAQPDADNLKNWSTPEEDPTKAAEGVAWQAHTKESPAFAAEYAALCLRYNRKEFGTIGRRIVEISPECNAYLQGVEKVITDNNIVAI